MPHQVPIIDATRCSGCGRCIAACHLTLFAFETQAWRKVSVLQDSDRCSACNKCEARCPIGAIRMDARLASPANLQRRITPVTASAYGLGQSIS